MPLYEDQRAKGHRFEAIQKVSERPLRKCGLCSAGAGAPIPHHSFLQIRGRLHVFDRVTKDDALRSLLAISLKSFKKDKF